MIHPGHPATAFLARSLLAAGSATLLASAGTPTGSQDEGARQEQHEQPRFPLKCLQDKTPY
jgi:hypothetical protein